MSDKEAIIEFVQRQPDDATAGEIIVALKKPIVNATSATVDYTADELTEDEWRQFVAYGLRDELADPCEDIYTLEDGTPSLEPR